MRALQSIRNFYLLLFYFSLIKSSNVDFWCHIKKISSDFLNNFFLH